MKTDLLFTMTVQCEGCGFTSGLRITDVALASAVAAEVLMPGMKDHECVPGVKA